LPSGGNAFLLIEMNDLFITLQTDDYQALGAQALCSEHDTSGIS